MTYCVGMNLAHGLLFASDSRTNAGVDHIATFCKMHVFETGGERLIVLLNAGNLATTQSVVSLLRARCNGDGASLQSVRSLYEAAELVGTTLREVITRDASEAGAGQGVDFGGSFLVGGQIRGEAPRLFNVYPQGNFIEASEDTPYFQIGEAKYGKPIIDRVIRYDTPLADAAKCTLISFDSTIRSNLSVGLPIDLLQHHRDRFSPAAPYRITADDPYFNQLRASWGCGLRSVFAELPGADWL
ncbi:proteasome-type protease [Jeongeupia naejangsanensis]|uniref:Proteasome-type protease n=1 Tax=Jeongeupia naejangsanensis TaxID=613195 RepID=A0ABS2BQ35_9NEIS|nr:proteasome-type protease [Jeongeupia naejangsanensis]MBM3117750.1 proteasome-type protease [Jeongeupia naejangsanensis]